MKRTTMSDMDSECDEVFTDDSKGTPPEEDNCHLINRKRRRGIIEKRRRDRINNSLSELRRLVPAAFEKQGSAKLEKAEILQLTVDHLKILHSKGMDPFLFEAQQFTMDYHGIGFRECVAEVARYLVGMEGMDLQDPLRMRLLSHLQCFAAQRDLAIKSATSSSPWSPLFAPLPATPSPHYPQLSRSSIPSPLSTHSPLPYSTSNSSSYSSGSEPRHSSSRHTSSLSSEANSSSSSPTNQQIPRITPSSSAASSSSNSSYRTIINSSTLESSRFSSEQRYSAFPSTSISSASVRPYRPWGAEVAY